MKNPFALLLSLFLLATSLMQAEWRDLDATALPEEWRLFQERMAARPWVVADFVEERIFPFRSRPVALRGTVWFGREEGLTLNYREPRRQVIRVEATGVRLIQDDGRSRDRAIPERGREIPSALLSLFRLDLAELEKTFALSTRPDGEGWRLRLVPRNQADAPIQRIELRGDEEEIRHIRIEQSEGRRIELTLSNAAYPPALSPEERARVFP